MESSKCGGSRIEIVFVVGFKLGNTARLAFDQSTIELRGMLYVITPQQREPHTFTRQLIYGYYTSNSYFPKVQGKMSPHINLKISSK